MADRRADGSPTKAFFVRMITRDITLEDCILDLIDNSIDGAWALEGGMPADLNATTNLSAYRIEVEATETKFVIKDNCGGISSEEARTHAFTFGRNNEDFEDYSIGVYGIGMKRAVFKIGRKIDVISTAATDQGAESFKVVIDVDRWLDPANKKDWDFPIKDAAALPELGVKIAIDDLTEQTSESFGNPTFIQNLRRMIARDYTLHLRHGLTISMNGTPIKGWDIELKTGEDLAPVRISYKDSEEPRVSVEIVAGMAVPPPEDGSPEDAGDDDRFGWYVACNGRIVLAADKGLAAGWGTDQWPSWHGQYNGFIGIVMFTSEQAALLPITTTKRSVDMSSRVYRRAQSRMRTVSKDWIAYTGLRRQAKIEAAQVESSAKAVPIQSLPARASLALPLLKAVPKEPRANIAYSVPLVRFQKLASALGDINMKRADFGLKTFDYVYKYEVDG